MLGTRLEQYNFNTGFPFILHPTITRTPFNCSKEKNWHDDIEIQLCCEGEGNLLLNGKKYPFKKDDIAVIGSNDLHYTGTESKLVYTCIIISADYCGQMGIDCRSLNFTPIFKNAEISKLICKLKALYFEKEIPCRTAKINEILLKILINVTENHSSSAKLPKYETKTLQTVKNAIMYIRENYFDNISLDTLAKAVFTDKFTLCKKFKQVTGKTVNEYINNYRCMEAAELLKEGYTVSQAANLCGFNNLSFFAKTFKKHLGCLPSKYKW